jgi:hypothetical protein
MKTHLHKHAPGTSLHLHSPNVQIHDGCGYLPCVLSDEWFQSNRYVDESVLLCIHEVKPLVPSFGSNNCRSSTLDLMNQI